MVEYPDKTLLIYVSELSGGPVIDFITRMIGGLSRSASEKLSFAGAGRELRWRGSLSFGVTRQQ